MSATTAASRIPPEILGDIFYHARDPPFISLTSWDGFPCPLGFVCKQWRSALFSHCKLWASIYVCVIASERGWQGEALNRRLLVWLKRSGEYPLNITFHSFGNPYNAECPDVVWRTFISCSYRWKKVALRLATEHHLQELALCKGQMPILESLTLQSYEGGTCAGSFGGAPRLTQVNLMRCDNLGNYDKVILPWSQLTMLSLKSDVFQVKPLLALLGQLKNVEELRFLTFKSLASFVVSPPLGPPMLLEHLRILEAPSPTILSLITAPLLQDLHLKCCVDGNRRSDYYRHALPTIISHSSCHIRRLTLEGFGCSAASFIFTCVQELEELCLIDEAELSSLITDLLGGFPVCVPGLCHLTIECNRTWKLDGQFQAISNALELRNGSQTHGVTPLKVLRIRLGGQDSPRDKPSRGYIEKASIKWASLVKVEIIE